MPPWGTFRVIWCPCPPVHDSVGPGRPLIGVFTVALCLLLAGANSSPARLSPAFLIAGMREIPSPPEGTPWAPAPVDADGLRMVASADGQQFVLHTAAGDRTFLPGVNLGGTTPGHRPGELSISAAQYRAWFAAMAWLGHPGGADLHDPSAGLLSAAGRVQPGQPGPAALSDAGRVRTDESYITRRPFDAGTPRSQETGTPPLRSPASCTAGRRRLGHRRHALAGRLDHRRRARPVRGAARSDKRNADARPVAGKYFRSTPEATPTERWLAARMNELAGYEAAAGLSQPIAFVNWPTTDPLRHPEEPLTRRTCPAGRQPRAADRELAGRDVRQLPRLPVLPRLPAARAGHSDAAGDPYAAISPP